MSYINDISGALVRVLSRASDGPPERFAGYAANRVFWVAEARHCIAVIDGYSERFERMRRTSQASHPPRLVDWPTIPISEPSMTGRDLSKARKQVQDALERFLRRCVKMAPDELEAIRKDAKGLGVSLFA